MSVAPYDEFIPGWDVAEMIRVFPDYIQYGTWCGPCWIDHAKYNYKIEGDKLLIKGFEISLVEFGKNYEETDPFNFVEGGKINKKIIDDYINWMIEDGKRIHYELKEQYKKDGHFQKEYTKKDENRNRKTAENRVKFYLSLTKRHKFEFDGHSRYSENAKEYIIDKIKNKDFDLTYTDSFLYG